MELQMWTSNDVTWTAVENMSVVVVYRPHDCQRVTGFAAGPLLSCCCGCCCCQSCSFHKTCKLCNTLRENCEWTPKGTTPFAMEICSAKVVCLCSSSAMAKPMRSIAMHLGQCRVETVLRILLCALCMSMRPWAKCTHNIFGQFVLRVLTASECWMLTQCHMRLHLAFEDVPLPAIIVHTHTRLVNGAY